jgi:hypothetical protein
MSYPLCAGHLKNGTPCRSVVVSLKSEEPLLRIYCQFHAARAAAAVDAQPKPDEARDQEGQPEALDASSASGTFPSDTTLAVDFAGKTLWLWHCNKCRKSAPDAVLQDAVRTALEELAEERKQQYQPLNDLQKAILSWPFGFHLALVEAARKDPERLVDLVGQGLGRGYGHRLDPDGGTEGVLKRLRRSATLGMPL